MWINIRLTHISPHDTPGCIVRLFLGGENGKNPMIQALFVKHGYITQPTSAGASSQNGMGERPQQTVGMDVHGMLHGAVCPPPHWEYAFYLFLRIHVILPHDTMPRWTVSARLVVECMYPPPLNRRNGNATTKNIIKGTLVGYGGSMKNFSFHNNRTKKEGRAAHETFDEAQLNIPITELNSNSLALWGALERNPGMDAPLTEEILNPPKHFCVFSSDNPFLRIHTLWIPIKSNFDHLGLMLETDLMSYRNIIVDVQEYYSVSQVD
jgi:hypothetical protein